MPILVKQGFPLPLGATFNQDGVNFAIYLEDGKAKVEIKVEDERGGIVFEGEVPFSTGEIRHLLLEGLPETFIYSYKVGDQILGDPFALSLATPSEWDKDGQYCPKAFFTKEKGFDWGDDKPPGIKLEDLIIYEMHVRGFSKDPSSGVAHPGTYLGVIEKIDFLKELGINAVELMPINEFNPYEYHPKNKIYEGKLKQYWGYSPVNYFCPMNRFSSGSSIIEFKRMVKALHAAGIEVILDMVFNHTAERDEEGPIYSYKGLGKETYYILDRNGGLANYTGTGNTFSGNHPIVINLILEALRYWALEMHVDGFRFDLASILYRGEDGSVLSCPGILEFITKDPVLSKIKLIAEPWDAAGLYQVGCFYPESTRWSEWNGRYRDTVRRFIKGNPGLKGEFATRLSGSEDLYGHYGRSPQNSINFITSHDGFTLRDLVSYNMKHNSDNGEFNRDGLNENDSWNCGIEGPIENPAINDLRMRQVRNFHLALMVSQGIPMLYMGDEYGHTKLGNNNTWCQDNRLNWFLWDELAKNQDFYRFYKGLIHFRKITPILRHHQFLTDEDIQWHGKDPYDPAWQRDDHFIAFQLLDPEKQQDLYVAFNATKTSVTVRFPERKDKKWHWIVNTSLPLSQDYFEKNKALITCQETFTMAPYSSLLLRST